MDSGSLSSPIRVLVVDDHGIVRDGVTALLQRQPGVKSIDAVGTGKLALAAALRIKPQVVLMDLMLPDMSGIDAIRKILAVLPGTRIIVLSVCYTSETIFSALRAGALGYVLKQSAVSELERALSYVRVGRRYLSPSITSVVIESLLKNEKVESPMETLSPRERQVLHLTAAGSSSAEIAISLSLSRKTVDTYRSRVMEKLGVEDLAGLIHFAIEHAMAPP